MQRSRGNKKLSSMDGVKCIESAFLRVLHKKTATKLAMLEKISIFGADFNNPNHTDLYLGYQKKQDEYSLTFMEKG